MDTKNCNELLKTKACIFCNFATNLKTINNTCECLLDGLKKNENSTCNEYEVHNLIKGV